MTSPVTINLVTQDENSGEWVLYLVEDGPWPSQQAEWRPILLGIQQRILGAVDVVVDGHLAQAYPDSEGHDVRIQLDSPSGVPGKVEELVEALKGFLKQDPDYSKSIGASAHIGALRLVTGKEIGRFVHQ